MPEITGKPVCSYVLIQTEHPKLFIFEIRPGNSFSENKHFEVQNMEIFRYVNSKCICVERHIRTEVNRLYHGVLTQRCILEQLVFRNTSTLGTQSTDEFAYHLMKGPGYMSVIAGEIVHIVKCILVEVKYHKTVECYLQLPVIRGNQSFYVFTRTHILTKSGIETNCNSFLPPMYLFGETWYKSLPNPVESIAPTIVFFFFS